MKAVNVVFGALLVAGLVLILPEVLGPGPRADFAIGSRLQGGALLVPLALIFLGGLLTALTPCVYPLIPITVSIFGARKASSRAQAVILTLTYVLGIAVMFTSLGIGAALTGKAFGSLLGNPWVVGLLAVVFAAFAVSMFGGWDFQLPSGLQTKLGSVGKAGFAGAFAMGMVAGIVAAPCTGPVLSGVLLHVATTQNATLGAVLLFTYALGLGVPFLLIGAFSLSLPKSGAWMDAVKSVFGIALLTLAAMYLRDAFPAFGRVLTLRSVAYGAYIATGLVLAGMLFGAVNRSFHVWPLDGVLKTVGVLLVVLGLTLRPHAPRAQPLTAEDLANWSNDETAAVTRGLTERKPVLIDFGAEWCAACKELERFTYTDEAFLAQARNWVLVKIDGTNENDVTEALYKKYKVDGLPTVVFIDSSGKLQDFRVQGYMPAPEFAVLMQKVN